jgi:SAM-dependent methyltransferase
MGSIPKSFTADYYNEDYFVTSNGKTFKRADGTTGAWSYANPMGEWLGCKPIVEAWEHVFNPKNALDVGCGRGTFLAYMRDIGIKAEGFDFSGWSVDHHYHRCDKKWIKNCDATKPWPYQDQSFDLTTALDIFEHIYSDKISDVISEMFRVSRKWVFLQIAGINGGSGAMVHDSCYILRRGEKIPVKLQGMAVAGHVTVQTKEWWVDKLGKNMNDNNKFVFRNDLIEKFVKLVPSDVISNWTKNIIIILERV